MTWNASLLNREPSPLNPALVRFTIRFTNGTETEDIPFDVSDPLVVKQLARNQIAAYEARDSALADAALAPGAQIDTSVPAPQPAPDPTPAQIATAKFQNALAILYQWERAVQHKLIPATDARYTTALQAAKDLFVDDRLVQFIP